MSLNFIDDLLLSGALVSNILRGRSYAVCCQERAMTLIKWMVYTWTTDILLQMID